MRSLSVLLFIAVLLAACSSTDDSDDITLGWSAEKLFREAKDSINSGAYESAIKYYEKLEARFPFGVYAQQAQLDIAYAYYKQGEDTAALTAIDRFIRLHPNHSSTDYAWYLKGLVNFKGELGLFGNVSGQDMAERDPKAARDSFTSFRQLVTNFPESRYVDDAQKRMKYLVNVLASHHVYVSDFYYRRGAYLAAVNRAQKAITEFPGAPANEKALYLMIKSYEALGLDDLRGDAARVMSTNFPDSKYLKHGLSADESWWGF